VRSTLIHPHTGQTLQPLTLQRKDGSYRTVWPILGASPDDNPDDSGDGDTDPDDDPENKGEDSAEGTETEEKVSKADYEKILERMKAADRRAAAAEKAVNDAKLKDASDLEKTKAELEQERQAKVKLEQENRNLALNQALLTHPEYGASKWEDPSDVVEMAHRAIATEDLTIDEDGAVKGLDKWLKSIASKKPYLLKKESGNGNGDGKVGASGGGVGSGRKGGANTDLSEEELRRKFPALNR
jgi:hypothetical protein